MSTDNNENQGSEVKPIIPPTPIQNIATISGSDTDLKNVISISSTIEKK